VVWRETRYTGKKKCAEDAEVNSVTLDNGSGFARRREISAQHNAPMYFAGTPSPWQRRDTNENMNGLIRFFSRSARISVMLRKRNCGAPFL
jgi:IS30 family transposase